MPTLCSARWARTGRQHRGPGVYRGGQGAEELSETAPLRVDRPQSLRRILLVAGALALGIALSVAQGMQEHVGRDFHVFWQAGRNFTSGEPLYHGYPPGARVFKYPPFAAFLFQLLALFPLQVAAVLFSLLNLILWVAALYLTREIVARTFPQRRTSPLTARLRRGPDGPVLPRQLPSHSIERCHPGPGPARDPRLPPRQRPPRRRLLRHCHRHQDYPDPLRRLAHAPRPPPRCVGCGAAGDRLPSPAHGGPGTGDRRRRPGRVLPLVLRSQRASGRQKLQPEFGGVGVPDDPANRKRGAGLLPVSPDIPANGAVGLPNTMDHRAAGLSAEARAPPAPRCPLVGVRA